MGYPQEFSDIATAVNNWGRWGEDDEIGTLNLITDDVVASAAALVKTGKRISCAYPLSVHGLQLGFIPGRLNPVKTMVAIHEPSLGDATTMSSSDDVVTMGLQAATHWDALTHVSYDGRMWNGFAPDTVGVWGADKAGIDKVEHLTGRGILLDMAASAGVERLEGGAVIGAAELDAAVEAAKVEIRSGDILLLRTGHMQLLLAGDKMNYGIMAPGPGMEAAKWFRDHDIAAVATDNMVFECFPCERDDAPLPVHCLNLVEMGMTQGQNWNLEPLAADCAADGVHEFLLEASPQPFVGGLGSPVNPVAIK